MENVQTNEFSEALAKVLLPAVQAVAGEMPVVAGMDEVRAAENCVLVVTDTLEEVVPCTFFYRVEGNVTVRLLGSCMEPVALRALRHAVTQAVQGCLAGTFAAGNVELDEYGCPATVKTMYTEFSPLGVEDGFYTAGIRWRAFVQF